MVRVAGVELQDKWKVGYALTNIKGIGWSLAEKILASSKIGDDKRMSDLSTKDLSKITKELDKYPIEGEVIRKFRADVQRLQQIGSYVGIRHQRGLPVRGQRTKTNARTKRGKKKTVGAFKKEELTKQKQAQAKSN